MPPVLDEAEIARRFTHHVPDAERTVRHGDIREAFRIFATGLADSLPESREKSLAFTALEEASFWAHAAVARQGK